jgi:hypothetical protein
MKTLIPFILIALITSSCVISSKGPGTSENSGSPTSSSQPNFSIQIVQTKKFIIAENDYPGNITFNGNNLILPIKHSYTFPNDQITAQYISTDLNAIGTSNSTYTGINTSYGHFTYITTSPSIGHSSQFWGKTAAYTSDYLSIRDDATGTLSSTTSINFNNFGCSTNVSKGDPITYCNGLYYGVCVSPARLMRLFSFNSLGLLQSAINTQISISSDYNKFSAITCLDNSNILIGRYNQIIRYDLNFNLLDNITDSSLGAINGMASDGNYLYIQSGVNGYGLQTNFQINKLIINY